MDFFSVKASREQKFFKQPLENFLFFPVFPHVRAHDGIAGP
jgi:hypothetical protein